MIEQEILIQSSDNPFDTKKVKVILPNKTKIISTEDYVLDALSMYDSYTTETHNVGLYENKKDYIVEGRVSAITVDKNSKKIIANIDVNPKFTAVCSLLKEPSDITEQLEVGTRVDVKVKTAQNGTMMASISDAMDEVKTTEILNAIGNQSIGFTGKVIELINGAGYWVDVAGIKCFMPGSLAGLNKLWDFNALLGKTIIVMPVSYSQEKQTVIVSHREYLNTLIPRAIESLMEDQKTMLTGFVTGTNKSGVFIEFNECLTGLILESELDEDSGKKFRTDDIKPGDTMSFWVKEIISNKKIILTQKGPTESVWDKVNDKYKPMMVTTGTVTKITNYGVFVELEKGLSGMIHKSKLKNTNLIKGDVINIKLNAINAAERRIIMSLP